MRGYGGILQSCPETVRGQRVSTTKANVDSREVSEDEVAEPRHVMID